MNPIEKAQEVLKRGGIVIFPTDTVYGIGAIWTNSTAIERLHKIKGTPQHQSYPVLISNVGQAEQAAIVTPLAKNLISKYWPGALTIVLKEKDGVNKIGFRMPGSDTLRELIKGAGAPVIGTSANFHGEKTPKSFEEIDPSLLKMVDYCLEGECSGKTESTVVDASTEEIKILREGAVKNVHPAI